MVFHVQNVHTYLTEIDPNLESLVSKICSISVPYFTRRKGQRHPDKKIKVYNYYDPVKKRLPSGLLVRVLKQLPDDDTWSIEDVRPIPLKKFNDQPILPALPTADADYSFQEKAVESIDNFSRGIFHYPTGSGKTIIMAKIIGKLGVRTLIVVPNLQLLNQTYDKFCSYFSGDKVGRFGEGDISGIESEKFIVVATQQSMYSLLKKDGIKFNRAFSDVDVLFIDEGHHVDFSSGWRKKDGKWSKKGNGANSWWKVAMELDIYYRYGMSATIGTAGSINRFVLESVTGKVVSSISVSELIKSNVLCPIDVKMYRMPGTKCGVWQDIIERGELIEGGAYGVNIIRNYSRNRAIVSIARRLNIMGKRILILVDLVDTHGRVLHSMLENSVFLCGESSRKERVAGLKDVCQNNRILIGTIFKEGFDMPEIDVLIIASGGKSDRSLIQKIGRVLRVSEGKKRAQVFDFYDRDGSMCERHSIQRLSIYNKEEMYKTSVEDWKGNI